ncbi:urease accessory protein UreF [Ectothiorhodospiraceae bacterium BW-2]|nr:urease accessory protein UreF [Ectothiorhodospiraceae bacterium BW-2]
MRLNYLIFCTIRSSKSKDGLGWVTDEEAARGWLQSQLQLTLERIDLPLLCRLYAAVSCEDSASLHYWSDSLLAWRDSGELRQEERQRGRALITLLTDLQLDYLPAWYDSLSSNQLAPLALAAVRWQIPLAALMGGYSWSWLEGQVGAAVKLVPLGQTAGQRLLLQLGAEVEPMVAAALRMPDSELGASLPALAHASSRHETQYCRLYRS